MLFSLHLITGGIHMNLNDRIDAIEEKVNNSSIPTGNKHFECVF
jgi:hypothetical protein